MSLKEFFQQDKTSVGVWAVIIAEVLPAALLALTLWLLGEGLQEHIRWFAGAALPALLVVRAYAKYKKALSATKGAIVTLFITFVAFLLYLIKIKAL